MPKVIKAVAAENHAGDDRRVRESEKKTDSLFHFGAVDYGGGAIPDATFWKNPDNPPLLQSSRCGAQRRAVGAVALDGNHIEVGKKPAHNAAAKQVRHGDPIDPSRKGERDDRRIEVADVIRRENKAAILWQIMIEDHPGARTSGQEHEQRLGGKLPEAFAPNPVRKTHACIAFTVSPILSNPRQFAVEARDAPARFMTRSL